MNQDTRKDPRAKVLTMTVRYKSATLDEFIEHHSYDVSRGGMFVKTPSPFPPGTLLKFEVKIADEQRLMQGVGRVVWKRESNDSKDSRPSGMGVKFIKIDDESRRTIERLVEVRGDGANAFDQGNAPRLPVTSIPTSTVSSTAPTKPVEPTAARSRKATVIGLGAMKPGGARSATVTSGPPRVVPPAPEKLSAEPFFPKSDYKAEMPPLEDQTMMKQARELLADALRHAGGSAEDVKAAAHVSSIPPHVPRPETNRSVPPRPTKRESEPVKPATRSPFSNHVEDPEAATTIWRANEAAALLAESIKESVPPGSGEELHGRVTARPPSESEPGFRPSEPATTPGTAPGAAAVETVERKASSLETGDETSGELAASSEQQAEPGELETKSTEGGTPADSSRETSSVVPLDFDDSADSEPPRVAAISAKPASERSSTRSRTSQAMLEAAQETSDSGGGKGVFALVALAAAAGIAFYLTRPPPAPPPAPEPVAQPAPAEPAQAAPPVLAAPVASVPEPAAAAPEPSVAPPASAAPAVKTAPAASDTASVQRVPPVRRAAPRRIPKKNPEPQPADESPPPAEAAPEAPPVEAAPEAPPPAPPPAAPPPTSPPPAPPAPTAPPLGDNPY